MTAPARFRQSDFERIFKAAKNAGVRVAGKVTPAGEIDFRMLTDGEATEQGPSPLRKKVFGGT